ncbi:5-formyltetrahydrofolate cyclo-ligase [Paenibacillus tuaregi]|uniref:5-formyltetrahydrofolate cyclo-ligase n=1 Tax=Paenibacillus tuaregi TaxID=1816681 RepID=UPI0008395CDA|nr:5-formyltetrahydrofolate cyclo-ligase [Paenibacillus tuaregi]
MDIPELKRELRERMLRIREAVPEISRTKQAESASLLAEEQLLSRLRADKPGGRLVVFSYLSFRDEPSTLPLIRSCWHHGDRVLIPRITGKSSMSLHEIKSERDYSPGSWGIPEPEDHLPVWPVEQYQEIDLVLVPGLAYDRKGGRIGFGAGYYDRFMEQLTRQLQGVRKPVLAALALQEQLVPEVPMEMHDFKLDLLFTADGVIRIAQAV